MFYTLHIRSIDITDTSHTINIDNLFKHASSCHFHEHIVSHYKFLNIMKTIAQLTRGYAMSRSTRYVRLLCFNK